MEYFDRPLSSGALAPRLIAPTGLDQGVLDEMVRRVYAKRARNLARTEYYDLHMKLNDFGISLPPEMKTIEVVLGWPEKAVSALADRILFDGFAAETDEDAGLTDLLADNAADTMLPQAFGSALVHSVAFMIATPGRDGEPDVVLSPKPATHCTGLWDARTNTLTDALSITEEDKQGQPTTVVWYARDHVTTFTRGGTRAGTWTTTTEVNTTGRCWAVHLAYQPKLNRPFGSSRISRAVMALTDAALRTLARSEAHAEFFAAPQRWATNVDPTQFSDSMKRWSAAMSQMLAAGPTEDGSEAHFGQFTGTSMAPHIEHLQMWASLFAAETSIPLDDLGIVHANPSSAEAIYAAKESLVMKARATERAWGDSLRRLAITAIMIRDNLATPPDLTIRAKWINPATPSIVSASDAIVKQISAIPWLAESPVALEALGYDDATIMRLLADKRRAQGAAGLAQALSANPVPGGGSPQ